MVGFDGVEEVVGCLGEEGVDGKRQRVEIGSEGVVGEGGVGLDFGDGGGGFEGAGFEEGGDLMEEGVDKVGVVDLHGEFDYDVAVLEAGFLEAVNVSSLSGYKWIYTLVGCELVLFVGSHELGRKSECA